MPTIWSSLFPLCIASISATVEAGGLREWGVDPEGNASSLGPEAAGASSDPNPVSTSYVLGAIGFIAVFGCGFLLVACQIIKTAHDKGEKDDDEEKANVILPPKAVNADKVAAALLEAMCQEAGRSSPSARLTAMPSSTKVAWSAEENKQSPLRHLGRSSTTSVLIDCISPPGDSPTKIKGLRMTSALWAEPSAVGDPGSKERAAVRAARRSRRHKSCPNLTPHIILEGLAMPVDEPADESDVVGEDVPQCLGKQQAPSVCTSVPDAKIEVDEQLKSTLREDITLRRKTFKFMCARWHPDKHLSGDGDLAKEVFQYIQEQKSWYLEAAME